MPSRVTPWWWPTCASRVAADYRDAGPMRTRRPSTVRPSRAMRPTASTSIARSAVLIRSWSDVDVVVVLDRHRHLGDDRAGVDAGVDHEEGRAGDLDAVLEGVARPVHAGERRAQRRVGVDGEEALEEVGGQQLHEARGDDQVGLEALDHGRDRRRPSPRGSRSPTPSARRSGSRPARRGRGPRCRRGRRRRRRCARRTPGRRRRR